MTDTFRYDQVCGPCDKEWRRCAGPTGEDYLRFVMRRRVIESKRSNDHLSAFKRAADFLELTDPPLLRLWR